MPNLKLTPKQLEDLSRGLVIAMKELDITKNKADIRLSDRLESIKTKIDVLRNKY